MSRTIRLLMFTCVLVAASQYAATSSAKANMLNLLCYMNLNPNNLMNYWIDFDNHTITNEIFNKQNLGAPRAPEPALTSATCNQPSGAHFHLSGAIEQLSQLLREFYTPDFVSHRLIG
jgi:hypothetical protein